jgi:zinc/manganese transport system ATP-binding protein
MSAPSREANSTALTFDDVSVVRGGQLIWSQSTFEVPPGGVVAVIGSNGSGKTTLLQVILGLVPVASGRVRVFGRRPGDNNDAIGYVPQSYTSASDEAIRVIDAVKLGLNGAKWAFTRGVAGQRRRVEEALQAVHATEFAGKRLSQLSGGQRQRVAIAAALVAHPKLLILDEPLASLDLRTQCEIVNLLRRLHDDLGVTILVVTHDLNPLMSFLHSAIYLLDGRAHYDAIASVVDELLLSRLYGTAIKVAHTPQGQLYLSGAL